MIFSLMKKRQIEKRNKLLSNALNEINHCVINNKRFGKENAVTILDGKYCCIINTLIRECKTIGITIIYVELASDSSYLKLKISWKNKINNKLKR